MKQTAWAHLPNAKHIDWVLASAKAHPKKWPAARAAARNTAYDAASDAAWDATRTATRTAARNTAYDAASDAAWYATRTAAWYAADNAIVALVAYDDCAYMIESEVDEIKILAKLGDQKAMLLLPACIVFNKTKELV